MKFLVAMSLLLLVSALPITNIDSSLEVQVWIEDSLSVTFSFEKINSTIYEEVRQQQPLFNKTSIPQTILKNLNQEKITRVRFYETELDFDDSSKSILGAFSLSGSGIQSFTFNGTTSAKRYTVKTDWRNFQVNLTRTYSLNFTEYFGRPLDQWHRTNYTDIKNTIHPAYYLNYTGSAPFESECNFILPAKATNIQTAGNNLIFEVPPLPEDTLLNSPFIILGAIITLNIIIFIYRKTRKK